MGQKVNPNSIRLLLNKDWNSRWISKNLFAYTLAVDEIIRNAIIQKLGSTGIDRIIIERGNQETKINIHSSRPGAIIGRNGRGIIQLKEYICKKIINSDKFKLINSRLDIQKINKIKKQLSTNIKINISEIRNRELKAQLIAQEIAGQLKRRMPYRRVVKQSINKISSNRKIGGIKIAVAGRLGGVDIARTENFSSGSIPLATFKSNVDYAYTPAETTNGVIGVKVWIHIKNNK